MTPPLPVSGTTPRSSTFNWTTTTSDAGAYPLSFFVTDDDQEACTCNVSITVNNNAPPMCNITPPGPIKVYVGNTATFQITGTDPDGNAVTITCTGGMPAGASMVPPLPLSGPTPKTSSFSWSPGVPDIGIYNIMFKIQDEHGLFTLCDIEINVEEVPPVSSVTPWGLILLILAVASFFGYIIVRRLRTVR
jgi:hypothetical protein